MVSDTQKKARIKWDSANMTNLSCKLRKDRAAEFKELCWQRGTTPNAVFRLVIDQFMSTNTWPMDKPISFEGLTPETAETVEHPQVSRTGSEDHRISKESMSMSEKIRTILRLRNMSIGDLAQKLGQSRPNLSNKLGRDNFTQKELVTIAEALSCTYQSEFVLNDTGEVV